MTQIKVNSSKQIARLAGFLYLALVPLGYFGLLYVPSILMVPDDMAQTLSNIVASESMFRLSIASALLMNIISIVLVLVLYKLMKPVGKEMASYMVVFLLLGAGISMVNEINHFAVLILSGVETLSVFTAEQSQYLVRLFLDLYWYGANIAAIFWGIWLFPLGYLIYKSNFLPKFLGVLLIIAGVGYLVDSFILFLWPNFEIIFSDYTFVGEIAITLWLLIKGVNAEQWEKWKLESE